MRKRITSLLLALVMLLSLVPALGGTARAAEEDKIEVHTYQQLQDALEQPGFNEIVLMEDIDAGELTFENYNTTVGVQEPIVIGANSFLWLDLNGHTLRLDTVFKLSHYIRVSGSSQLTIDDNSPGKTGKIIGHLSEQYFVDEPSAGVILVSGPEAVLNVVGGTIAGENCPAVHVRLGVAQISGDAKIQRIQDRKPFGGDSRVNKWPQKPALVVKAAGNNVPTVRIGPLPDVDANPQILGDVILDAEKIWEHRVIKGVAELQRDLINMLEIALHEKREKDAEFLADLQESLNRQFYFPEWMCYNAHLQLALVKKDKDESLSILQKMLPSMKKEWKIQSSPLYRNADGSDSTWLSGRLAKTFADEIANNEEYAFLREGSELEELLAQLEAL